MTKLKMTTIQQRRVDRILKQRGPLVKSFLPAGRSQMVIYAVCVRQHPDKVKIGMTANWRQRQRSYQNWDLSPGDAVTDCRVFVLTEEFVDLRKIENHILKTFTNPLAFGAEWFLGTIDDAARHIDRFLTEYDFSYEIL